MSGFQVTVAKEALGFSAAHFLALPGHICERLHGHNYRVAVTATGPVDPATGFVVDFAVLKRVVRELIEPLDHRVLVPSGNGSVTVREEGDQVAVDYGRPSWLVVPRSHACLVPVQHTTAELLAEYLGRRVWERLSREGAGGLDTLVLELEESTGQTASFTMSRAG